MMSKDEEQWWTARNCLGQTGSIPVPYIEKVVILAATSYYIILMQVNEGIRNVKDVEEDGKGSPPSYARVKQARVPNAYDKTALSLQVRTLVSESESNFLWKVGDLVKVTKMSPSGLWEGELGGKMGHFPFTHVEVIHRYLRTFIYEVILVYEFDFSSESGVEDMSS